MEFDRNKVHAFVQRATTIESAGGPYCESYFNEYKFAELIVQACIDEIENYHIPVGNSPSGEMACVLTYDALKSIRASILEKFEVKHE